MEGIAHYQGKYRKDGSQTDYLPIQLNSDFTNCSLQMHLLSIAINQPIQSVTQLYWDGYLYNRNKNSNSTKVNKTYYFYCKGCNASLILKFNLIKLSQLN